VLHDVQLDPPGVFSLADLAHYRIAVLKPDDAIQCVSFHTPSCRSCISPAVS
jgi:hypothetical protein